MLFSKWASHRYARGACLGSILALSASSLPGLRSSARAEEAVVLSGGGSRGLAHVGALEGLERKGHDPVIVIGASMGAIIGALYASGYDPAAIRKIVTREDWLGIFTPYAFEIGPTRSLRYPVLRLRTEGREALVSLGYVPDWQINRKLAHLLFPPSARAVGDFDRLPRRFRSVTADLETGEVVSLSSGDLSRAVRASMAAPGFFAPVGWGGRILVDGGIADYLPVDEGRALGADTVIAVDVVRPPKAIHSLDALAVARRSTELMLLRTRSGRAEPDVLLLPKVDPSLSPYVYLVDPTPVIDAGLKAALEGIVARPDEEGAPPPVRELPPGPSSLETLLVEATSSLSPFLRDAFRASAPAPYDPDRVVRVMDRLYATGLFDGVWPSVEESTGVRGPALIVRTEARGPVSLAGAVGYDNDRGGRIWASLRHLGAVSATPVEVGLEGSANGIEQWGTAAVRLSTLSGPPMGRRAAFAWVAGGYLSEAELPFFQVARDAENPEVRRAGGWLGFEARTLDPELHAKIGLRAESIDSDVGAEGSSYGLAIRLGAVPELVELVGTAPAIDVESHLGDVGYARVRAKGSVSRSVSLLNIAVLGDFEMASRDAPLDQAPAMGNEYLVPALRWGEHRGRLLAVAGLDVVGPGLSQGALRLRLRGGVIRDEVERGRADLGGGEDLWAGGGAFSALWWTPFGRVEAGLEADTLGDRRVTVSLGPDF